MSERLDIAVVHGGTSSESHASTENALFVGQGLRELGHRVTMLNFADDIAAQLSLAHPELVYICVQGKGHGDGYLQTVCDKLRIPYTGSKAVAAALINDKNLSKRRCQEWGIATPKYIYLTQREYIKNGEGAVARQLAQELKYPLIAKAVGQGGGFGIEYIASESDLYRLSNCFAFDQAVVIEEFINGPFVTVGLLQLDDEVAVFPPLSLETEGYPGNPLQQYNKCYKMVQPEFTPGLQRYLRDCSRELFLNFHAANYARIDYILEAGTNELFFLEINAVPGMKPDSFFPLGAEHYGLSFTQVLEQIITNEMLGRSTQCAI